MTRHDDPGADPASVSATAASLLRNADALSAMAPDAGRHERHLIRLSARVRAVAHALQLHAVVLADTQGLSDEVAQARRAHDSHQLAITLQRLQLSLAEAG